MCEGWFVAKYHHTHAGHLNNETGQKAWGVVGGAFGLHSLTEIENSTGHMWSSPSHNPI